MKIKHIKFIQRHSNFYRKAGGQHADLRPVILYRGPVVEKAAIPFSSDRLFYLHVFKK